MNEQEIIKKITNKKNPNTLLISPHYDDESLFAFYTLLRYHPKVIIATEAMSIKERKKRGKYKSCRFTYFKKIKQLDINKIRQQECNNACRVANIKPLFLNLSTSNMQNFQSNLLINLTKYQPDLVFAPALQGGNTDHDAVFIVCSQLWSDKIIYYSTYNKNSYLINSGIEIKPTKKEIKLKNKALNCYQSQLSSTSVKEYFSAVRKKSEYWIK